MYDIDTFRSTDFGTFLLETKLIRAEKEKFIVHWARRFFDFRLNHRNMTWSEQLPLFLKELNESGSYQDWRYVRRIRPFDFISAIF